MESSKESAKSVAREAFARSIAGPDEQLDLARVALLIAAEEAPDVDVAASLRDLDALAESAAARMGGTRGDARETVARFHAFFFREQGFHGNEGDYYDPRNSYLHEVLERRTGIPISLAVVYLEVARRLGYPVRGIGFPGHFLCKWELDGEEIVVDPFHGSIVAESDLRRLLDRLFGGQIAFRPELLTPLSNRGILVRMLANLKGIWVRKGAAATEDGAKREHLLRAIGASDRILMLSPEAVTELRDRGLLWLKIECARPALADLERYVATAPGANDAKMIAGQVLQLRDLVERIC